MYVVGQTVTLGPFTFTDANGTLVDPSPLPTVTVTLPDGTPAVGSPFTAVKDSTGIYHYNYTPTVAGIHQYYSSGTVAGADAETIPDVFTAAPTSTAALISLNDGKETLNKVGGSNVDDGEILLMIRAATGVINGLADYTVATPVTETLDVTTDRYGRGVIILSHAPVMTVQTIVGVLPNAPTVTVDQNNLDVPAGIYYIPAGGGCYGPQKVAYTAGRTGDPSTLQEACRLELQHLWQSQSGGATTVPNFGGQEVDQTNDDLPYRVRQLVYQARNQRIAGVA